MTEAELALDDEKRMAKAKELYKADVQEKYANKNKSAFKHLFRSKGFIWLSNHPNSFFEWNQAAIQLYIDGAIPWVGMCTDASMTLEEQAKARNIGTRKQSLVFIGQHMKEYKAKIKEELGKCLVTTEEW